jgi:hypothetical protein
MRTQRWIQRTVPLAAAAIVSAAPMAFAQWGVARQSGQELFEWTGRVDREVQIVMRGNQVSTRNVGNTETGRARSRVMMDLPRRDGQVGAQLLSGRGNVDVVQQPSSQNGYTTIIRVTDAGGGSDNYRVAAFWQNYANGDVYGRDGNRDRDRDDIYDRGNNRNGYPNRNRGNGNGNGNGNGGYNNNGYQIMHWSGNVDGELEIRMQNGRVDYRNLSGAQATNIRLDRGNMSMPQNGSQVAISQGTGRGSVTVVQQPSSWNGYTTVIRVRDPQGGYGYYDFDLVWR